MNGVETTGIGSLPFLDVDEALDHVFDHYSIPFYPQLPQRLSRMGAPLMVGEVAANDLSGFYGFEAFLARAQLVPLVKMQLVGPLTLARFRKVDAEVCWRHIEGITKSLAQRLPAGSWLIWDDAVLARDGSAADVQRFHDLRMSLPVRLGIHCCAEARADAILSAFSGTLLALDDHVTSFAGVEASLIAHYAAGGELILGIFDTRSRELDLRGALLRLQELQRIAGNRMVFISGGCGTGLHTPDYERQLASGLKMIRSQAISSLL